MPKAKFVDIVFKKLVALLEESGIHVGIRASVDDDDLLMLLDIQDVDTMDVIAQKSDVTMPISDGAYYFKNIPIPHLGKSWSNFLFWCDKEEERLPAKIHIPFTVWRKEQFALHRDAVLKEARESIDEVVASQEASGLKGIVTHYLHERSLMSTLMYDIEKALRKLQKHSNTFLHADASSDGAGPPSRSRSTGISIGSRFDRLRQKVRPRGYVQVATTPLNHHEDKPEEDQTGLTDVDIAELVSIGESSDFNLKNIGNSDEREAKQHIHLLLEIFSQLCNLIRDRDKERRPRSSMVAEKRAERRFRSSMVVEIEKEADATDTSLLKSRLERWNEVPLKELKTCELYEAWSSQDLIKILRTHLSSVFDAKAALREGIIDASFPLHERPLLHNFDDWAGMHPLDILSFPKEQHSLLVRSYFGEEIAFLFSYLYFQTRMLFFPCLVSGIGRLRFLPIFGYQGHLFERAFEWFMVAWLCFTVVAFRQDVFKKNLAWGMTATARFGTVLGSFQAVLQGSMREKFIRMLHWAVVFFFVVESLFAAFYVNNIRAEAIKHKDIHKETPMFNILGCQIPVEEFAEYAMVINIKVVGQLWKLISPLIARFENHWTDAMLADSQVVKNFVVMCVVTYYPFFYLAFIKRQVEGCGSNSHDVGDEQNACLADMVSQVTSFFIINVALNIATMGFESACHWYLIYQDARQCSEGAFGEYTDAEEQAKRAPYDGDMAVFLEQIIELGFITLFSGPLPIMCFVVLLTNMVKLRLIAWRLINLYQRPVPTERLGIGQWRTVLHVLCYMSGFVSLSMNFFALTQGKSLLFALVVDPLTSVEDGSNYQWTDFVCNEHVVFAAIFFFIQAIQEQATADQIVLKQQREDCPRLLHFSHDQLGMTIKRVDAKVLRGFHDGGSPTPGNYLSGAEVSPCIS